MSAQWVRIAVGTDPEADFAYVSMAHVRQAQVVATTSGPSGFTVELGDENGDDIGSVYARWDTAAEANAALQLLVGGVDLSATVGEEL